MGWLAFNIVQVQSFYSRAFLWRGIRRLTATKRVQDVSNKQHAVGPAIRFPQWPNAVYPMAHQSVAHQAGRHRIAADASLALRMR